MWRKILYWLHSSNESNVSQKSLCDKFHLKKETANKFLRKLEAQMLALCTNKKE